MADIPIAYDPCTCQYPSMLEIVNNSVKYLHVKLDLIGEGETVQVIENGGVVNRGNRFANVAGGITNGIAKGNSAYKSASELISVVDKLLVSSANKRITPQISNTLSTAGLPNFSATNLTLNRDDLVELHSRYLNGQADAELEAAIKWLTPSKLPSSIVPDWIKNAVPFANTAFALLDFIIGGGKSTPPKPMHFQSNFKFEGTGAITDESYRASLAFRVPGSEPPPNNAPVYHPNYDKIMGILNLVEQPVMHQAQQPEGEIRPVPDAPEILFQSKSSLKLAAPL